MAIVKETLYQLTDIYNQPIAVKTSGSLVYVTDRLVSYYASAGSLINFAYSTDGGVTYVSASENSFETINGLPLTSSAVSLSANDRDYNLVWDAGTDLNPFGDFDVIIRQNWGEVGYENVSGSLSYISASLSFTSSNEIPMDRPYPKDDMTSASFQSLVSPVRHRNHFVVFWDTGSEFVSASYASSDTSQTNWSVSESAFPAAGVLTETGSAGTLEVVYSGISGLINTQTYYLYVSRSSFSV